jgi:phosphopantothenoylcysteine decarboxylase / phosphopantothenate---cysteine ligase
MGLAGKHVLITCGPTWVVIDPVRVISNRSSGELGQTIATDLHIAGANVTLLEGPVRDPLRSKAIRVVKFCFYDEFFEQFKKELRLGPQIVVHAAAVADYRPRRESKTKLASSQRRLNLTLVSTPKIINQIKRICPKALLVGFKLETTGDKAILIKRAKKIISEANCDLVVANSLAKKYQAYIVERNGSVVAQAGSRKELSRKLVRALRKRI